MISAAFDLSVNTASFAVLEDGKVLKEVKKQMHNRDSASLPCLVTDALNSVGLGINDVKQWSIGAGPGSFTGIRIVAALTAGWSFGRKDVSYRAIPGAFSLAAAANPQPGEDIAVLFDGRNHEFICFWISVNHDGSLVPGREPVICNALQAAEYAELKGAKLIVHASEANAVNALLPEDCKTMVIEDFSVAELALNKHYPFDNDLDHMVYIRPAVFTRPKE
jgi:tRNA threonylcarbamoyl adenosine modification protein YeaZ